MLLALTREVTGAIVACELTHQGRQSIDVALARIQHQQYEDALKAAGCRVERLAAAADMPDSVFIEDVAVVVDELAVATRPGAPSRRAEVASVAGALRRYRPVHAIEAPGTVDGGDVFVAGRRVFVGRSSRTNRDAVDQMRRILAPYGYKVSTVEVDGCLHLKSAVTAVAAGVVLLNPSWVPDAPFADFERIEVDPAEPMAANALRIANPALGDRVIYPQSFPRTLARLERRGVNVLPVDVSELQKAEGGVTCCSVIVTIEERAGDASDARRRGFAEIAFNDVQMSRRRD